MPANDGEVFDFFTSSEDTEVQIDFIAYAIFAHHKKHWIDLYKEQHDGAMPSQDQINEWISNITNLQYEGMKEEAARFFDSFSRDYLKDEIETEKRTAIDTSILVEIKKFTSAWRHLGIALLMAIVAPFLLGGIIYFSGLYHHVMSIPTSGH